MYGLFWVSYCVLFERGLASFCCMWLSTCPNKTICWRNFFFLFPLDSQNPCKNQWDTVMWVYFWALNSFPWSAVSTLLPCFFCLLGSLEPNVKPTGRCLGTSGMGLLDPHHPWLLCFPAPRFLCCCCVVMSLWLKFCNTEVWKH